MLELQQQDVKQNNVPLGIDMVKCSPIRRESLKFGALLADLRMGLGTV